MLLAGPSSKRVTYAVELYFDEILEAKLIEARKILASQMFSYSYYNPSPKRYLTLTEPEIHSRPCMTLFTASSPSGDQDIDLAHRLSSVVNDFYDDISSPGRGILPVILDLDTVFDVTDKNFMFLSALDRLREVNGLRKSLFEEMSFRNINVKGNYGFNYNCWMPIVHVFKQTWEQYYAHKAHDEKCWKDFCKENNSKLFGYVNMIAVVQSSPKRLVRKTISLQDEPQVENLQRVVNYYLQDEHEDEDQDCDEYSLQDGEEDDDEDEDQEESDVNHLVNSIVNMQL